MNAEQKKALDIAVAGHNLLLLGSAGTGKSFTVCEIYKRMSESGKHVQLTCSTGIACSVYHKRNLPACTVHKFLGLSDGRYDPKELNIVHRSTKKYEYVYHNLSECDCLIVDECSLLSARTFLSIIEVCMEKTKNIQLIFAGDFFQLPPVANPRYNDDGTFCFCTEIFQNVFPHKVILKENIRADNIQLVNLITEIFYGQISPDAENFLLTLSRPLPCRDNSMKLFSKNALVDDFNRTCLLNYPGPLYELKAKDSGEVAELERLSVPKTLWIKVGCPVILLQNLSDKLVNGLLGHVQNIEDGPVVKFEYINLTISIPKVKFSIFSPSQNRDIAVREQYPLKAAFALTIHKAQGMTLDSVEVDCREIFKPGQLGVALSRASSPQGLRVINYHPRYVLKPSPQVTEFMGMPTHEMFTDMSCCMKWSSISEEHVSIVAASQTEHGGDSRFPGKACESGVTPDQAIVPEIELEECWEDELEDDFNDVISSIITEEEESESFNIPEGFSLEDLKKSLFFEKEVTPSHIHINQIVSRIDETKLTGFVKKLLLKMSVLVKTISATDSEEEIRKGIAEKNLSQFYHLVHMYSTSSEYKLVCLSFFESEGSFTDDHSIICYQILEYIRMFYIRQKVQLLQVCGGGISRRYLTDASKARVRYVAGYCVAKLRNKYVKRQKSNMYSVEKQGQEAYFESKCKVNILNILKEEEEFLRENSVEPDSLIDVQRKQNIRHGLTNVADSTYAFFISLTEAALSVVVNENLVTYGKDMYRHCYNVIYSNNELYEQFCCLVTNRLSAEKNEDFHSNLPENFCMYNFLQDLVLISSQIHVLFKELIEKYLHVLLAQFRKDVKSAGKIEKKMAHRKQIKVSQKGGQKSNQSTGTSSTVSSKKKRLAVTHKKRTETAFHSETLSTETASVPLKPRSRSPSVDTHSDSEPGPSGNFTLEKRDETARTLVIQPTKPTSEASQPRSPSANLLSDPVPGPSGIHFAEPDSCLSDDNHSRNVHATEDSDICKKCLTEKNDDWIQCDSCSAWFHRKCAGLKAKRQWKKFSKEGVSWFCLECL